jgi:hypothetical protein
METNRPELRPIRTREEADAIEAEIEEHADGWVTHEGAVDFELWLDRLETDLQLDLGDDLRAPGIKRVLAIGRRVRREARG